MDARGGILEPPGIVEVKYRAPQQAWLLDRLGVPSCNRTRPCMGEKRNLLIGNSIESPGDAIAPEVDKTKSPKTFGDKSQRTIALAKLLNLKEFLLFHV